MKHLRELGVKRWLRYVDDIFATFDNKEDALKVLDFINNQHPNLKFTVEYEKNNQLAFLDTLVSRNSSQYFTTLYRKSTFTGVYLNWTSLTSKKYKIGLIKCLLDRIWKICSKREDIDVEIEELRKILDQNEYPKVIVEQEIDKYLKKKLSQLTSEPKTRLPESRFIVLPFVHRKEDEFAVRLKQLVKSNFPQVEFNVAFKAPSTIGDMFPFKDSIEKVEDMFKVVYKLNCETCGVDYIGKTT